MMERHVLRESGLGFTRGRRTPQTLYINVMVQNEWRSEPIERVSEKLDVQRSIPFSFGTLIFFSKHMYVGNHVSF